MIIYDMKYLKLLRHQLIFCWLVGYILHNTVVTCFMICESKSIRAHHIMVCPGTYVQSGTIVQSGTYIYVPELICIKFCVSPCNVYDESSQKAIQ